MSRSDEAGEARLLAVLDAHSPRRLKNLGDAWDRAMMAACVQFTKLDAAQQEQLRAAIDRGRSWVTIGFAERMATLAVRVGSRDLLVLGLVGLSLFNDDEVDSRDALIVYALLIRAAVLLDTDPAFVRWEAAATGRQSRRRATQRVARRPRPGLPSARRIPSKWR